MHKEKILAVSLSALLLSACGGGGDDTPAAKTVTPSIGVFIDSAVSGLQYKTTTYSDKTNSAGEYKYLPGETVIFSVGGVVLGSTLAGPVTTPLSLVPGATGPSDPVVTNIVRLLLTLDENADPSDGIEISAGSITALANKSINFDIQNFDTDPSVTDLLAALPNSPSLVNATDAQEHFASTMTSLSQWGNITWGSGTWKSSTPSKLVLFIKDPKLIKDLK